MKMAPLHMLFAWLCLIDFVCATDLENDQEYNVQETINITMSPLENFKGVHSFYTLKLGLDCENIEDTSLPTKLILNTSEPDAYQVVAFKSRNCNGPIAIRPGSAEMYLNDRHPICSFKFDTDGNDIRSVGRVKVVFFSQSNEYIREFNEVNLEGGPYDICNQRSAFRFPTRITVWSEQNTVDGFVVFLGPFPSHRSIIIRNDTDVCSETIKERQIARSFKVLPRS